MMQLIKEVAEMGDDAYAELAIAFCEAFEGVSLSSYDSRTEIREDVSMLNGDNYRKPPTTAKASWRWKRQVWLGQ